MCAEFINNSFIKPQMNMMCEVLGLAEINGTTLSETAFEDKSGIKREAAWQQISAELDPTAQDDTEQINYSFGKLKTSRDSPSTVHSFTSKRGENFRLTAL